MAFFNLFAVSVSAITIQGSNVRFCEVLTLGFGRFWVEGFARILMTVFSVLKGKGFDIRLY
jgi:hypothetical protein